MRPIEWTFRAHVDASPEDVYAWMIDFRDDDHRSAAFLRGAGIKADDKLAKRRSKRRVVSSAEDSAVLEDVWGRSTWRTTVRMDPRRLEVWTEPRHGYSWSSRAVPEDGGTRFEATSRFDPPLVLRLFMPMFAGKMRRQAEMDFRGHVEDMRDALARAPAR